MGMPVKLSNDLVEQARDEAKAADRSITSQIEHWARLGRSVEHLLRHDDAVALKRAGNDVDAIAPMTKRAILSTLREIASQESRPDLAAELMRGRTVYQDAGDGLIERIASDGSRAIGRLVGRRFVAGESHTNSRHK